jgi:hypothetical protein
MPKKTGFENNTNTTPVFNPVDCAISIHAGQPGNTSWYENRAQKVGQWEKDAVITFIFNYLPNPNTDSRLSYRRGLYLI